jgi:D-alanine-D-alanine ligase
MPARVLILYNQPLLPGDHPDAEAEHEILDTVEVVRQNLATAGHKAAALGVSRDPAALVAGVREHRPDVVFNLFEGTAEQPENETYAAGILEWLGVPFTGCPSQALTLARNKHLTKYLLRGAGLPTADFLVVDRLPVPPCPLPWPVIVKLAAQDASVGLDQGSVVTDRQALERRVRWLLERYGGPVLVEEFIAGRELIVGLIERPGLTPLPVAEILFEGKTSGYWPIVTYDAKWAPESVEFEATPPRYPAEVSPRLATRLQELAARAFRLLGCRDYGRVDFRVRRPGRPYILEVNPNPDFHPEAGLTGGLQAAGLSHAWFTARLVENALARSRRQAPAPQRVTD